MYTKLIEEKVDGLGPWVWPDSDTETFFICSNSWKNFHRNKIYSILGDCSEVVVQAGGNCGLYPKLLSKKFKVVYTFEPDPVNFYCLVNNCTEDNIIKFQCALAGENYNVRNQNLYPQNVGMNKVIRDKDGLIPTVKIDDFNLNWCDLIWLDTEGFEEDILKGSIKTISKFNPIVICENGDAAILEFLKMYGRYEILGKSAHDTIYKIKKGW